MNLWNAQNTINTVDSSSQLIFPPQIGGVTQYMTSSSVAGSDGTYSVSAKTIYTGIGAKVWGAFDNSDVYPAAHSDVATWGQWWYKIQLPVAKIINQVKIKSTVSGGTNMYYPPRLYTIQGSNDATNWTTLYTQSTPETYTIHEWTIKSFTNTNAYLHYRINITSAYEMYPSTASDNYVAFGELEFWKI